MMRFKCSASCGDMIYSLILVKHLCEQKGEKAIYYIHHDDDRYSPKRNVNTYAMLKRLFEHQDYVAKCLPWKGEKFHYDLDKFRKVNSNFANTPLPARFFLGQGLEPPKKYTPWLKSMDEKQCPYYAFNQTARYDNHGVNWQKALPNHWVFFVGLEEEYLPYQDLVVGRMQTNDLLDVAKAIAMSSALFCNQSACLTIAQGLGHMVYLAKDKRFNNTILGLENLL